MYSTSSLSYPDSVLPDRLWISSKGMTLELIACRSAVPCPNCARLSHRIHSHYVRTLADLPWQEKAVCIRLHARRFFCTNGQCKTHIFTERFPEFIVPYGRRTLALHQALHLIGLALGGRAGARLAQGLKMRVARDSILRALRRWPEEISSYKESNGLRIVGIDDWAFRKGQRYGTIFCDLERHRVLDLLPDRSAESAAAWFRAHPDIQIISRDRGGIYAQAAREGAPQAIQIADRFHLLKNLGDMLQRLIDRHHGSVRQAEKEILRKTVTPIQVATVNENQEIQGTKTPESSSPSSAPSTNRYEAEKVFRRQRRLARYEKVVSLHQQGLGSKRIARQLGMSRVTVRRYLHAGEFPEVAPKRPPVKEINAYREQLRERWEQGCRNGMALWREIRQQGFTGSEGPVYQLLKQWRMELPADEQLSLRSPPCSRSSPPKTVWASPRQIMWLLLYPEASLAQVEKREGASRAQQQREMLETLPKLCPEIAAVTHRCHEFIGMVCQRQPERLDMWLKQALAEGEPELTQFAKGILKDYAAVKAALQFEWSNGQVEGQVNRLKMIKRQMYGRANFDLLRLRVQQAA